jgi:hypothetical protein
MAQHTTIAPATTEENNDEPAVSTCRHHWVIQPADGPVSNGLCQVCGETREFKNYVESATWGDSRITNKTSSASSTESTSDDSDVSAPQAANEEEAASEEVEA